MIERTANTKTRTAKAHRLRAFSETLKQRLPEPESADFELRVLMRNATGWDENVYFTEPDRSLPPAAVARFEASVDRRANGEPLAYILGEAGFMNLRLKVTPAVLIPRPATESLVLKLLSLPMPNEHKVRMLDLGTGSGAIALSVQSVMPNWQITATDVSVGALEVAGENAERYGLDGCVKFHQSDWFDDLGTARFDVIAANPPYIAEQDACLSSGGVAFEPRSALTGGSNGMKHLATIIADAPSYLRSGGWLILEHGHTQGKDCCTKLQAAGLNDIATYPDLDRLPRISLGRMPDAPNV